MKKKMLILIIVIVILLSINSLIILNYKIDKKDYSKLSKIKDGLLITDLVVINNKKVADYLECKNIKVENIFHSYKCSDKDNMYTCTNDDKSFSMGVSSSYTDKFKKYNNYSRKILSLNKIKSDLELFGKIKEVDSKTNFFNLFKFEKEKYLLNSFALDNIPIFKSMDLIEGDYSGLLMYQNNGLSTLYIYYNNKTYSFVFNNFNEKSIKDFINTIVIE